LKFAAIFLSCGLCLGLHASAQTWSQRVAATQARQPHWINPLATTTARLEQGFRFDFLRQETSTGTVRNFDGSRGLKLIPARRIEAQLNLPPYLMHHNPAVKDGWGDFSFNLKLRLLSRPEKEGNAIVTAFLGGSIPTGQYKNGSAAAIITPTLAGGKGWGWFDVQSTLAGNLPVDHTGALGRSIVSNTAFQAHVLRRYWPEVEINSTSWAGGTRDGKKQVLLTPGLIIGRFPMDRRVAFTFGGGFQIATTHYHTSDHNVLLTSRVRF
jgi:hypothetical protein